MSKWNKFTTFVYCIGFFLVQFFCAAVIHLLLAIPRAVYNVYRDTKSKWKERTDFRTKFASCKFIDEHGRDWRNITCGKKPHKHRRRRGHRGGKKHHNNQR